MKNFAVYKSSAGSGKTFTLVKEYLKISLSDSSGNAYKRILAITFTNKAAQEMKSRILSALISISKYPEIPNKRDADLLAIIAMDLNLSPPQIQVRAKKTLENILHNYSDFSVGTIDSFVHKIIRTFSLDLRLPNNFEVEMDANKIVELVIDNLLSKVGDNPNLTQLLIEFTLSQTEDEKNWNIENDLADFSIRLLKEDSLEAIEKLKGLNLKDYLKVKKTLTESINLFENTVTEIAKKAILLITENHIDIDSFSHKKAGPQNIFYKIINKKFSADTFTGIQTKKYFEKGELCGKTSPDAGIINSITPQLTQHYNAIQAYFEQDFQKYTLFKMVNANIFTIALANEISQSFQEITYNKNLIHSSEFNKLIANIVIEQPVPFIYERLGNKYKHYLIDEFQDTSTLQFHNFLPLIENSLSEGNFNMIVGDGKQAIYRWRGGEVDQFTKLPNIESNKRLIKERETILQKNYDAQNLDTNYRSKRELIEFNNHFFEWAKTTLSASEKAIYDNQIQKFNPTNTGGYVHFNFLEKIKKKDEKLNLNNERTLEIIQELQADNYQLKNIAILYIDNKSASSAATFLTENNIDIISSESLLLSNSAQVIFIINCIRFIKNVEDEMSKVSMINFLVQNNLIIEDLHSNFIKIANKSPFVFQEYLQRNGFNFLLNQLIKLPIYELTEELINVFKLNEKGNSALDFLLNAIHEYNLKYGNDLQEFLDWWGKTGKKLSIIVPEGMNAVTIMTYHKAKGLEFPVVILPNMNWSFKKGQEDKWIQNENSDIKLPSILLKITDALKNTPFESYLEDENNKTLLDCINLLYVAFTRPKERLYIITESYSSKKKDNAKITSIQEFINHYFNNNAPLPNSFGIKTSASIKLEEDNKSNNRYLKTLQNKSWKDKVRIKKTALSEWQDEKATTTIPIAIGRGILVHKALEQINYFEDIESVLNNLFINGQINEDEKVELKNKLSNLLKNNKLNDYFTQKYTSRNESEILLTDGTTLRPDKIVFKDNKATIIDYKTGHQNIEQHSRQINQYGLALEKMGFEIQEKLIVYIENEEIVSV